jgi:hypothetical protein
MAKLVALHRADQLGSIQLVALEALKRVVAAVAESLDPSEGGMVVDTEVRWVMKPAAWSRRCTRRSPLFGPERTTWKVPRTVRNGR